MNKIDELSKILIDAFINKYSNFITEDSNIISILSTLLLIYKNMNIQINNNNIQKENVSISALFDNIQEIPIKNTSNNINNIFNKLKDILEFPIKKFIRKENFTMQDFFYFYNELQLLLNNIKQDVISNNINL